VAIACALYTVGVQHPRQVSIPALAASLAAVAAVLGGVAAMDLSDGTGLAEIGFVGSLVLAAWTLGRAARERRAHAARTVQYQTQQAVIDERLRIAREMHDIVAHSMTLIAVKAAVGNHVAHANPQEAREALRVIETTSRRALVEIRRALGVLRDGSSYTPAPGLPDLAALTDQAAAGGVQLDLTVTGDGDLPQDVGLSVYRIVQESLTNVIQHAAPARCQAVVAIESEEILIEVTDDGRRQSTPTGGGHGLIGMRERVSMYGGRFSAGPRPDGGFQVTARLPYTPQT
jgi:signal transduction histidine kinase